MENLKFKIKENKEIQKRYTDLEEKRKEKERRIYLEEERNDLRTRRSLLLVTKRKRSWSFSQRQAYAYL
jgi:hypothetical protein